MNTAGFVKSSLLEKAGFRHAFFTRRGGVSEGAYASLNFSVNVGDEPARVRTNLERAAAFLGIDPERLYFLSQVHGAEAIVIDGTEDRTRVVEVEGDALLAKNPECAVSVRIADCVPILVGDAASGAALAIHAGWRGLVAGIVERGIHAMRSQIGDAGELVAAIGPHIRVAAFEVSDDVAEMLRGSSPDRNVVSTSYDKPHVDLCRIARAKLRRLGLPDENVDDVGGCTVREPSEFFSFRRDGRASGRHLAAIVPRR